MADKVEEVVRVLNEEFYPIIVLLLAGGHTINWPKVRIMHYVLENENMENGVDINQISRALKIDYKNTWRYVKQLIKAKVITSGEIEQGKKAKLKFNSKLTIKNDN